MFALLKVRNRVHRTRLFGGGKIGEIHVVQAFFQVRDGRIQINLMLVVIERENVQFFGKMVEHNINMPRHKITFGNVKFIGLRRKRNRVAAGGKFVAQIAQAA